jgi:predicted aldo/keto reductase-like oxidoreductase
MMAKGYSRREFLEKSSLAGLAAAGLGSEAAATNAMPTRVLGRTGARISILALGCGSRLLMYRTEEAAVEAINAALDSGITYLDTAYGYGDGRSEGWVGQVAKARRKEFFLATKIEPRDGDTARRILEGSLKRLQTSQIDLIHVHALMGEDDLAKIEASDGVLNALYAEVLKTALERHDFDCVQMALNAAKQGMKDGEHGMVPNPAIQTSFERVALPVARQKNLGILAMKIMGQEALIGSGSDKGSVEKLLQYSWSLPVAAAVVGMPTHAMIRQNAQLARNFAPMPEEEMRDFSHRVAGANKMALDLKFRDHVDC